MLPLEKLRREEVEERGAASIGAKPAHTIIIPAYNEEQGLPVVLEKILKLIDDSFVSVKHNPPGTEARFVG
ncbi:hypothetical protein [Neomoorella thermoacetica]|uniref:hypothetical protein n=1 Tax=Neomoorella thermoacetica TaxID=1525 RepID=UPI00116089F1|nr:hypothetical protein [Moorella thermoacetica]